MWWQLFIVLVATAAASENDHDEHSSNCISLIHQECVPDYDRPMDFPGNGEELEAFCKFAVKYFDCSDRRLSSCNDENSTRIRVLREAGANVRRLCNEDPLLRTAVAAVLPCFKQNLRRIENCDDAYFEDDESFMEAVNEIGLTDIEGLENSGHRCLIVLYSMGCTAVTAGRLCGDVSRDIMVNIFQGFDVPFEFCPPGAKEKVPLIAEVMQMEVEKANSVEQKLNKKK